MKRLGIVLLIIALAVATLPATAKGTTPGYQTAFVSWRAADNGFADWGLNGTLINDSGQLELDIAHAMQGTDPYAPGTYFDKNYYNGGSFLVGEALSPVVTSAFSLAEAIASWNAFTPPGSWVEVQIRAQFGERWTKWYTYGVWASDYSTIERHSVSGQGDADASVYIDTFVVLARKATTNTMQLKVMLFSADGIATPTIRNVSLAYSSALPKKSSAASSGNPGLWNTWLNVPECSQMVYPDGGNVWCSPTSTSMILGYWQNDDTPCEPRVRAAVAGVYDWKYDGHGNWPFNTAYAATYGYEGYVARFTSLEKIEQFVAAGVPVAISIAWDKGDLTGAPIPSSAGHLMVVAGFDSTGNPIVNDPAAPSDDQVTRTYLRGEFESLWLSASGGAVYLIYPEGHSVPPIP